MARVREVDSENICLGTYRNYILMESPLSVLGVPSHLASYDLSKRGYRWNPQIIEADSVSNLKKRINGLSDPNGHSTEVVPPELKVKGYRGHNIYYYASRYFGVPEDRGPFDIRAFRADTTNTIPVGHTVNDVKDELKRREQLSQSSRSRVLLVCCARLESVRRQLDALAGHEVTVLCADNYDLGKGSFQVLRYSRSLGTSHGIELQAVSSQLLDHLREQRFDLVVIPYEDGTFWEGIQLEQFTSAFATCIVNVFPNGRSRMYRGEDVHRIQYNKAYLNSMFKHVPSIKGKKVLEVGCADGLACDLLLSEEPDQITGVDVMDIVGCAYRDPRVQYRRVGGAILPFEDNTFDLTYSIATFEHCFDPPKLMEEIKRVTKPGGYCYIQAGPLYFSPFGHHMFGYFDKLPWAHLRMSPAEMINDLKKNGLADKIRTDLGTEVEAYVHSMINIDHVNGRRLDEYRLASFEARNDLHLIASTRSYEGEDLLTKEIERELSYIPRKDLVAHGFEVIFKKKG